MSARWDGEPGADTRALLFPEAAVRRPKLEYAHQQVLAFLGVCCIFGAMFGALYAAAKGWLR